jgi:hypothetical protein
VSVIKIKGKLPFGIGEVEWAPNTKEKDTAWHLYVEFSTRITRIKRKGGPDRDFGSARLAMGSLYTLLGTAREILREGGSSIVKGPDSLGPLTLQVLNRSVRKLLDEFHTSLEAHESYRKPNVDRVIHERKWEYYERFWNRLVSIQNGLQSYIDLLEDILKIKRLKK